VKTELERTLSSPKPQLFELCFVDVGALVAAVLEDKEDQAESNSQIGISQNKSGESGMFFELENWPSTFQLLASVRHKLGRGAD
jgi:hypothetical protein